MNVTDEDAVNEFVLILRSATDAKWCMKPYCTTCGALDYRSALRRLGGPLGGPLIDALSGLDPREAMTFRDWSGALEVALIDLPFGLDTVLESWLRRAGEIPPFDDFVVYRVVRRLPASSDLRQRWLQTSVRTAVRSHHFSLTESLLLTLRADVIKHPELIDVATQLAIDSSQMRRVLRNVGL